MALLEYVLYPFSERASRLRKLVVKEFADKFNPVKFVHLFPGYVYTQGAKNAGFPAPVVWASNLFGPILARTIFNSAQSYSEIPVYAATQPEKLPSFFLNSSIKPIAPNSWTDSKENRQTLWTSMCDLLNI